MALTYHVMVPFDRNEDGDLVPLEPVEAQSAESAKRKAAGVAAKHAGAITSNRTGDPNTGEFRDAVVIATFGEVDRNMLGE